MNQTNPQHYVGYLELAELIRTHDPVNPLYLSATSKNTYLVGTAGRREWFVTVSDIQNGVCRYWLMMTCAAQTFSGETIPGENEADFWDLHEDAAQKIRLYIDEQIHQLPGAQFFAVHQALVAVPNELRMLEGKQGFLKFDKAINRYLIREELAQAV